MNLPKNTHLQIKVYIRYRYTVYVMLSDILLFMYLSKLMNLSGYKLQCRKVSIPFVWSITSVKSKVNNQYEIL